MKRIVRKSQRSPLVLLNRPKQRLSLNGFYPVYLVYNRERDSRELQQTCELLREVSCQEKDWSQR